jgi:hypothetical protein
MNMDRTLDSLYSESVIFNQTYVCGCKLHDHATNRDYYGEKAHNAIRLWREDVAAQQCQHTFTERDFLLWIMYYADLESIKLTRDNTFMHEFQGKRTLDGKTVYAKAWTLWDLQTILKEKLKVLDMQYLTKSDAAGHNGSMSMDRILDSLYSDSVIFNQTHVCGCKLHDCAANRDYYGEKTHDAIRLWREDVAAQQCQHTFTERDFFLWIRYYADLESINLTRDNTFMYELHGKRPLDGKTVYAKAWTLWDLQTILKEKLKVLDIQYLTKSDAATDPETKVDSRSAWSAKAGQT